jgi:hypothetical protein
MKTIILIISSICFINIACIKGNTDAGEKANVIDNSSYQEKYSFAHDHFSDSLIVYLSKKYDSLFLSMRKENPDLMNSASIENEMLRFTKSLFPQPDGQRLELVSGKKYLLEGIISVYFYFDNKATVTSSTRFEPSSFSFKLDDWQQDYSSDTLQIENDGVGRMNVIYLSNHRGDVILNAQQKTDSIIGGGYYLNLRMTNSSKYKGVIEVI